MNNYKRKYVKKKQKIDKQIDVNVERFSGSLVWRIISGLIVIAFVFSLVFYNDMSIGFKKFMLNAFSVVCVDNALRVYYIDVGQADCIAIDFPNGKVAVIDAGENDNDSKNAIFECLDNKILNDKTNKVIDYFIITHAHQDHIGCAVEILEKYDVANIYRPSIYSTHVNELDSLDGVAYVTSQIWGNTITSFKSEVSGGAHMYFIEDEMTIDDINLKFYLSDSLETGSISSDENNNYSPIIKVENSGKTFLFNGDMEMDAEARVLANHQDELDADVLKVGHHGSDTSTSAELLEATTIEYAIISVGAGNKHGHPCDITFDKLEAAGVSDANILRTDQVGDILIIAGGSFGFIVKTGDNVNIFNLQYWQIAAFFILLNSTIFAITFKKKRKNQNL